MTARRRPRHRQAQLAFDAISIEGGLLSPDWLSRVAQLAGGNQSEADYRIPKGLNVRDEIGRYWRIAQALWTDFSRGRAAGADARALAETFVPALLRDGFGFASLRAVDPVVLRERSYPIGFAALEGHVPVVVAPAGSGLDMLVATFGDAGRRRSAFGVAQEYLNTTDDALWGVACDGTALRILRDNASLTRPAWIEADLQRIFTEEGRYADFAALWLLVHETRFGRADRPPTECALEAWRNAGREEGTRAREHLRHGVEEALVALGQGFLRHPENAALRMALQDGSLTTGAYFQQLLRLVYRLIFLLTVEERELLHPESASEKVRRIYAEGYGLRRLRERSVRRSAHDRHSDLWDATRIVLRSLAAGEPRLGLPALAGIFAADQCPTLDSARLENRALLLAVFRLSWLREDAGLARVNWRDMGPEELGSVYESLLELVPEMSEGGRVFAFATGGETKGNARKLTGSYYTPDDLVQVLLDSALEPVVESTLAANPERPVEALLELSIVDPACGSGHFLLAAARRVAAHVARLQSGGTPSAAEYRHAMRQVVSRCVYGVDLNPMAVELCKVSLWMEAVEPGLPLTFLNSHIQCGNALLGTTPELMAKGIPNSAWDPVEGDDKKTASVLKKRNKKAAEGQRSLDTLWTNPADNETQTVTRAVTELDAASDVDVEALAKKEERWVGILGSPEYRDQKFVADAWCAAFAWPKQPGEIADAAPTNELWRQLRDGQGKPPLLMARMVGELADQYLFFHWHLQFPQVFAKGGFDVVLGNPPWEKINLKDSEFFAVTHPEIANAPNKARREELLSRLRQEEPDAYARYDAAVDQHNRTSAFLRLSGCYPYTGVSRINLYSVFCETGVRVVNSRGRTGMVLASGIATDDNNKALFESLVTSERLVHVWDFDNSQGIFPAIHRQYKFCLFCAAGQEASAPSADFAFFLGSVGDLRDEARHFTLTPTELALLNPVSRTCPTFRSARDARIAKEMYSRMPAWSSHRKSRKWPGVPKTPFNMSNDSKLFCAAPGESSERVLPVYESKYIFQFNHRFATSVDGSSEEVREFLENELANPETVVRGRYWLPARIFEARFPGSWFFGYRMITNATNERTAVATVFPPLPCVHSMSIVEQLGAVEACVLLACVNSFCFDYAVRQKVAGTNFNHWIWHQLPFPEVERLLSAPAFASSEALAKGWILPRVLELTYTAWDLDAFARDVGYAGPPFRWDPGRRFHLRCELDAAFLHIYGLSRDDAAYVLDTFPIVRRGDEKAHGEYRTKRVILEIYDAMAAAIRTGKPYETRLDPPPADARMAHPDTREKRR